MTYLAHIAGDGRKQTAAEHLNGTAERCALFAAPFGAEELGRLAGLSHDLGKYSMEFQRRLDNGPKVDHATAGAFACWRMGQPLAAFAAAGHHGGLPDGGTQGDSPDAGTFLGRMKRAERGGLPDCSPWTEEIALPSPLRHGAAVPDILYPDAVFLSDGRGFPGHGGLYGRLPPAGAPRPSG